MHEKSRRPALYLLAILFAGFICLTLLIVLFPSSMIDREFSEEVQEYSSDFLDLLMTLISYPGYYPRSVILIVATSLAFILYGYKKAAFFILLTSVSGLLSTSIKMLINRPRPTKDLVTIVEQAEGFSFPSGHVTFYVIFFGFLAFLMLRLRSIVKWIRFVALTLSLFMILSVPLSRVYLGAHWFSDVLGGFLIGMTYLIILMLFYLKKKSPFTDKE